MANVPLLSYAQNELPCEEGAVATVHTDRPTMTSLSARSRIEHQGELPKVRRFSERPYLRFPRSTFVFLLFFSLPFLYTVFFPSVQVQVLYA